jgi:hypothetical protein
MTVIMQRFCLPGTHQSRASECAARAYVRRTLEKNSSSRQEKNFASDETSIFDGWLHRVMSL